MIKWVHTLEQRRISLTNILSKIMEHSRKQSDGSYANIAFTWLSSIMGMLMWFKTWTMDTYIVDTHCRMLGVSLDFRYFKMKIKINHSIRDNGSRNDTYRLPPHHTFFHRLSPPFCLETFNLLYPNGDRQQSTGEVWAYPWVIIGWNNFKN